MGGEISTSYSVRGIINGGSNYDLRLYLRKTNKSYNLVSLSNSFLVLHVVETELLNWP